MTPERILYRRFALRHKVKRIERKIATHPNHHRMDKLRENLKKSENAIVVFDKLEELAELGYVPKELMPRPGETVLTPGAAKLSSKGE